MYYIGAENISESKTPLIHKGWEYQEKVGILHDCLKKNSAHMQGVEIQEKKACTHAIYRG